MKEESDDILEESPAATEKEITPRDLMSFAKNILIGLALLFFSGAVFDFIRPSSTIFEACETVLPPIATLVIGYYFGKSA